MCVMKYLKHYVKHSLTQICSMYSISISVIINIIFTTHYCLLELFHCNFIFFSNLWIMRSLKLKFAHSLFLLKEVFNWNGFKNLNNNCVQKKTKTKTKTKKTIFLLVGPISYFLLYIMLGLIPLKTKP